MVKEIVNPVFRNPRAENILPVWDKDCEVLLVGSMTAKDGMDKGFYYASSRNQLWELLDYALDLKDDKSFLVLKNQLKENHEQFKKGIISIECFETTKNAIRKKFAQLLLENKIAMCDVFESCYFNGGGSMDQDIILNNDIYPCKSYKQLLTQIINQSKIKKVVVNSRFVESQFRKMNIEGNYEIKYVISPSPRRGSIEKKRNEWKVTFENK